MKRPSNIARSAECAELVTPSLDVDSDTDTVDLHANTPANSITVSDGKGKQIHGQPPAYRYIMVCKQRCYEPSSMNDINFLL